MLSIGKLATGQADYYLEQAAGRIERATSVASGAEDNYLGRPYLVEDPYRRPAAARGRRADAAHRLAGLPRRGNRRAPSAGGPAGPA